MEIKLILSLLLEESGRWKNSNTDTFFFGCPRGNRRGGGIKEKHSLKKKVRSIVVGRIKA